MDDTTYSSEPAQVAKPVRVVAQETLVTGLVAVVAFLAAVAIAIGSAYVIGSGVYAVTEPECTGSSDVFCGLASVLAVAALAGLGALAAFVTTALQVSRLLLPPDRTAGAFLTAIIGLPCVIGIALSLLSA